MKKWSSWRQENHTFFKKQLENIAQKDLLDVGAGEAQFYDLYEKARSYTAIDWQVYPRVTVVADITKLFPFKQQFDIVVLSNTLEHIFEPVHVIKEAYRVLRFGGRIIGTVPFIRDVHQAPYDFHRYTHFALQRYLSDAGFRNISIEPIGSPQKVFNLILSLYVTHIPNSFKKKIFTRLIGWLQRYFIFDLPAQNDMCEGYGFVGYK